MGIDQKDAVRRILIQSSYPHQFYLLMSSFHNGWTKFEDFSLMQGFFKVFKNRGAITSGTWKFQYSLSSKDSKSWAPCNGQFSECSLFL